MPSMSQIASIAAFVTQPSCSCASISSGMMADCSRPFGYLLIHCLAAAAFALLKAKEAGWTLASALRRHHLAVEVRHRAGALLAEQKIDALAHDLRRLAHLFHAHEIAVEAVAVLADRDVEIHLGVAFIGLRLAQVPGGAGAAHHYA